jgi:glutamate mutase epsilon subunit
MYKPMKLHYLNYDPIKPHEVKELDVEEQKEVVEIIDDLIDNTGHLKPSEIELLQKYIDNYRKLNHHKDTTCGLYATDKQEEAKGESFFQITY